jgi:subtilisin family serine protease
MATKSESGASSAPESASTQKEASISAGSSETLQHQIKQRKGQFLIAPRQRAGLQTMGLMPMQFSAVEQALRDSPDIEIIDRVGAKSGISALGAGFQQPASMLVARMDHDRAQALMLQSQGQLIVERDQPLHMQDVNYPHSEMVSWNMPVAGAGFKADFVVMANGKPVKDAEVYLFGSLLPATGTTDANGKVSLTLFGESAGSIRRLYVKPKMDYWSFYQEQPDVSDSEINVIGLRTLAEWPALANFPQQQILSWGQKAMRLDQLPQRYRGQGIKIAIIDSGAANTHDDLKKITRGYDIINKARSTSTWNIDTISHGSHCAGIIAGADTSTGIRGFAPDAEVHACKLFPGGQISQLIDALEYCIEKQIDVVNLSLGGTEPSEALEQQIQRARQAGVACIVAAGNSGGAVQYPASSPNVMAVAAIGRMNEFPADSYHSQTITSQVDGNGFFSARFSCYGPEIAVCAPGVAITSSVPDNNFAAWDGTSMAAPHVTGLAALVLAHHPEFQGSATVRSAERVERLFQIIKMSCRPVQLGDQRRTGYGLPDVLLAVGLVQSQAMPTMAMAHPYEAMNQMLRSQQIGGLGNVYREGPRVAPYTMGLGMGNINPYASWLSSMQGYGMPSQLW